MICRGSAMIGAGIGAGIRAARLGTRMDSWGHRPLAGLMVLFMMTSLPGGLAAACAGAGFAEPRLHLSTSTRYQDALDVLGCPQGLSEMSPLLGNGSCTPFYNFFVCSFVCDGCPSSAVQSRHGTREPTKKRVRQLNAFAPRMRQLGKAVAEHRGKAAAGRGGEEGSRDWDALLRWMQEYESPWAGHISGGQLTETGEQELYAMAQRMRRRFPSIFSAPYHSQVYPMYSTQVARSAASAVAFGMGLFEGHGGVAAGKHRAFAVISETEAIDTKLRFHDLCDRYTTATETAQPHLDTLWYKIYAAIAAELAAETGAPFEAADVDTLWLQCRMDGALNEAGGEGGGGGDGGSTLINPFRRGAAEKSAKAEAVGACGIFSPGHVAALEWVDDVNTFMQKGYGREVNFRMAVPLYESMAEAVKSAASARAEGNETSRKTEKGAKPLEKAQLHFAHAETIIPLVCLLGLFQEARGVPGESAGPAHSCPIEGASLGAGLATVLDDVYNALKNFTESSPGTPPVSPLPLPPPHSRVWQGRHVSPYAANTAVVLVDCGAQQPAEDVRVLVAHNERAVTLPGCGELLCPLRTFLDKVVASQLVHSFSNVCAADPKQLRAPRGKAKTNPTSTPSWTFGFLQGLSLQLFGRGPQR